MQLIRLLIATAPIVACGSATNGAQDAGETTRETGLAAQEESASTQTRPEVQTEEPHVRRLPELTDEELAALPPDGGDEYNRLVFEGSPYLLQHARNPVDWYPWGEEAFARARAEDKPIFLSIGYSTCHWCHVMEHESFEDEAVAALMNEHFVCIKVDREERPDVDQVYMTATQAATNGGGWPMTVVMTPERAPFFAGTYFPRESQPGRVGMMDLVPSLADAWANQRETVVANAEQLSRMVVGLSAGSPGALPGEETLALGGRQLASTYDAVNGGFGTAPKFPVPHNLGFLLRRSARTGEAATRLMVDTTLEAMRKGGIWDHVGFGFHRYSTDPRWLLPHFEKMLYDQALIAIACIEAWQATGNPVHRDTAERIFEYVLRDMTSPEGGFYSAEDADSEGEEGLFYLWTPDELRALLGDEDGTLAIEVWNVEEGGNFLDQATGRKTGDSILHLSEDLPVTAARLSMELEVLLARMESMRSRMFEEREARIHPLKDEKVLTDWNGLMIASLAKGARTFGDERYAAAARRAADFVLTNLRDDDGRLLKRWRNGKSAFPAVLDDYAFMIWGLIELYETDFDTRWLEAALELNEHQRAHFLDEEQGGFFLSADDGEQLFVRTKEVYDGALPSGNSVSALNLVRLARLTGREELEALGRETLQAFGGVIGERPYNHTALLAAVDFIVGPSHEVVIVGEPGAPDTEALLGELRRPFLPNAVTILRPIDDGTEPAIARLAPYVAAQTAVDGHATAYVCRNFACQAPTTDAGQMLANLGLAADGE